MQYPSASLREERSKVTAKEAFSRGDSLGRHLQNLGLPSYIWYKFVLILSSNRPLSKHREPR